MMKKTNIPQSREVARKLIRKIHDGDYQPGKRLESIRTLAERYGVGRQVVVSAISLMARNNYVYTARGSGVYVNPKLKKGLYYRLGWFYNGLNPALGGIELRFAYKYAAIYGFELLPGFNYEENFTLAEWLGQKGDLDGIIINGNVDEELLKYPRRHRIPYVVFGNYDISPEHPQINYDIRQSYAATMENIFRNRNWRKIAIFTATGRADREALEGVKDAIANIGQAPDENIIFSTLSDGYAELVEAMPHNPDVLVFCGTRGLGIQKYCELHPDVKLPDVVININQRPLIKKNLNIHTYELDYSSHEKVRQAVLYLVKTLKANGSN